MMKQLLPALIFRRATEADGVRFDRRPVDEVLVSSAIVIFDEAPPTAEREVAFIIGGFVRPRRGADANLLSARPQGGY